MGCAILLSPNTSPSLNREVVYGGSFMESLALFKSVSLNRTDAGEVLQVAGE
jgi:hypothetical protein